MVQADDDRHKREITTLSNKTTSTRGIANINGRREERHTSGSPLRDWARAAAAAYPDTAPDTHSAQACSIPRFMRATWTVAHGRDWADILHHHAPHLSTLCQINHHIHIGSCLEMPFAGSGNCRMWHCVSWTPGAVPVPNRSCATDNQTIRNLEWGPDGMTSPDVGGAGRI